MLLSVDLFCLINKQVPSFSNSAIVRRIFKHKKVLLGGKKVKRISLLFNFNIPHGIHMKI